MMARIIILPWFVSWLYFFSEFPAILSFLHTKYSTVNWVCRKHNYREYKQNVMISDYDDETVGYESSYCPSGGLESMVISIGNRRILLASEYQAIFRLFRGILDLHVDVNSTQSTFPVMLSPVWPTRRRGQDIEVDDILAAEHDEDSHILSESQTILRYISNNITIVSKQLDIDEAMRKFRKTILGVEKYRINNPGSLSRQYCTMLRTCLDTNSSNDLRSEWGYAANALQYAGLSFRDHVTTEEMGPILSLESLWIQSLSRLLDLDSSIDSSSSSAATWDQKYFSQIQCQASDVRSIQDMQLSIMRVAMCALFSSLSTPENIRRIKLKFKRTSSQSASSAGQKLLATFQPTEFSVRLLLTAHYSLVASDDVPLFSGAVDADDEDNEYAFFDISPRS